MQISNIDTFINGVLSRDSIYGNRYSSSRNGNLQSIFDTLEIPQGKSGYASVDINEFPNAAREGGIMLSIKKVLMERDGVTPAEADSLIKEAVNTLRELLEENKMFQAWDICSDFFGLEPDYLDELIFML